jgi:hypothetical protein
MEMPEDFLAAIMENLPKANIVGFGFGEQEGTCMVKAYLEFGSRFYRAIQGTLTNRALSVASGV